MGFGTGGPSREGLAVSIAIVVGGALAVIAIVAIIAFNVGQGCAPVVEPVETGIDAGPGEAEIDAREAERLAEIERAHAAEIAAFDERQREKYDALREDPDAADAFIRDFNRRMREKRQ